MISLRKKGADVKHSAAFNTSEQHFEKQDAHVAPGELIFQATMENMTSICLQMYSEMEGMIFLSFSPFHTF